MKKDNELEKAKELAKLFLHMPVDTTEYSPMFITHPFWESAFVSDGDGVFNLLEDKDIRSIRNILAENVWIPV